MFCKRPSASNFTYMLFDEGELEDYVTRLEGIYLSHHNQYYDSDPIFPATFAASRLRNRGQLGKVVHHIANVLGPPHMAEMIRKMVLDSRLYSGKDTISRSQSLLDATLCCMMSKTLSADTGPLYFWMDSSPQHGVDWFLSTLMWIPESKVELAADAVHSLVLSIQDVRRDSEDDEPDNLVALAQQRDDWGQVLADSINFHRQIPIALASGRTGVEYKLKALIQKVVPEAQTAEGVCRVLQRSRVCCVDLGEKSVPNVSGLRLQDVAPTHLKPDFSLYDGSAAGSTEGSEFVFPRGLLIAGSCHVFNNMAEAIDSALDGWAWWMVGISALAHLLHCDHLRL